MYGTFSQKTERVECVPGDDRVCVTEGMNGVVQQILRGILVGLTEPPANQAERRRAKRCKISFEVFFS